MCGAKGLPGMKEDQILDPLSAGDWSEADNTGFGTARLSISSPLSVGSLLFDGVGDTLQ